MEVLFQPQDQEESQEITAKTTIALDQKITAIKKSKRESHENYPPFATACLYPFRHRPIDDTMITLTPSKDTLPAHNERHFHRLRSTS